MNNDKMKLLLVTVMRIAAVVCVLNALYARYEQHDDGMAIFQLIWVVILLQVSFRIEDARTKETSLK